MQSETSIDEYKKYIRELKTMIKQLQAKNKRLVEDMVKFESQNNQQTKGEQLQFALKANKKAVIIQKTVRGFIARSKFRKMLRAMVNQKSKQKSATYGNEVVMTEMLKAVEIIGFNLEMLYRAGNVNGSTSISVDEFRAFIRRLKLKVKESHVSRFLYLIDEDFTGIINEQEYLNTLVAFKVNSEPSSNKKTATFIGQVTSKFDEALKKSNINVRDFCQDDVITYSDLIGLMDERCNAFFNEKEKFIILNFFDRKKLGYVEKADFLKLVKLLNRDPVEFADREEAGTELNSNMPHDNSKIIFGKTPNANVSFGNFVNRMEKYNKNLKQFFDGLASHIKQNSQEVKDAMVTVDSLTGFVATTYEGLIGKDSVHEFITAVKAIFIVNNGPIPFIDILELKNKLESLTNCKLDSSKLPLTLYAISLDHQDINTEDHVKRFRADLKRKIDFSEFFILAQKILKCNFNDVNHLFAKYDIQRRSMFELNKFIDDVNSLRKNVTVKSNSRDTNINIVEEIRPKLLKAKINVVDNFMNYVNQKMSKVNRSFDKVEIRAVIKEITKARLDDNEIAKLSEQMDENANGEVEFYELVEFITDKFNAKDKIVEIYTIIIANYLDTKRTTVKGFLANYSLYEESSFDKSNFTRKLKLVMGLTENHSEEFFEKLKGSDNNVQIKDLIKAIQQKRNMDEKECVDYKREAKSTTTLQPQSSTNFENKKGSIVIDTNSTKTLINKPSIEISKKGVKILHKRIEEIKDASILELEALNHYIMDQKNGQIHILQIKKFLKHHFDDRTSNLLLNYIRYTDTNNNGYIGVTEWVNCAVNLGLSKEPKKQVADKGPIKTDGEFYEYIVNEIDDEHIIDRDFIEELDSLGNLTVSVIKIKQLIRRKLQNFDIKPLLRLLNYLDNNKNGFINYGDFKFMLVLMSNKGQEGDIDYGIFRKYGLDIDKIKAYSEVEGAANKLNLFKLTKNIMQYLNSEEEERMISYVVKVFNEDKGFIIDHSKFIEQTRIMNSFEDFESIVQSKNCKVECKHLKTVILLNLGKKQAIESSLRALSMQDQKKLIDVFDLPFNSELKTEHFINFILFYDFDNLFDVKGTNNVIKLSKQPSLLKEDNFDVLNIALDKLYIELSELNYEEVLHKLEEVLTRENEHEMCYEMFTMFIKKISSRILPDEIFVIFKTIDVDENRHVSENEFIEFYERTARERGVKIIKSSGLKKPVLCKQDSQTKSFHEEKLSIKFQEFKLQSTHFFNGSKTILTDITAALKVCFDYVSEIENTDKFFEDPEFGPNKNDIYGSAALYHGDPPPGYVIPEDMVWLRTNQIVKGQPAVFLYNGANTNDVIQGAIGDCWFISALSVLAINDSYLFNDVNVAEFKGSDFDNVATKKLVSGVYPKIFHFLAKFGLYVFRFFKDYQWIFVIIDDKLPCYAGNEEAPDLVFAKCYNKNEFWVPLIEKAYAKVHGTYEALISGQIDDGLVDMTGCVSEKLKITDAKGNFNQKLFGSKEQLWTRLNEDLVNGSLLGCSILGEGVESKIFSEEREFTGLYAGHAYSILDFIDIGDFKLVRIRNPWGSDNPIEWTGPWADNSAELIQNLDKINTVIKDKWKDEAELVSKESQDGSFIMNYHDFLRIWHNLSISKKFPDHYSGYRFPNEWNDKSSGGTPYSSDPRLMVAYMKNPQYILTLKQPTHIFMSLGQKDGRIKSKGEVPFPYNGLIHPLSLCVFKLDANEDRLEAFDGGKLVGPPFIKNYRDVQVDLKLDKGKYAIVPSTKNEGMFGRFFLNVYFDCDKSNITLIDIATGGSGNIITEEEEIFNGFDEDFKRLVRNILLENQ